MSTAGGMGVEAAKFHKRLAEQLSEKKPENYADNLNCIRMRLKFCFLIAIISVRGKKCRENAAPITMSFYLTDIMVIKQYSKLSGIA